LRRGYLALLLLPAVLLVACSGPRVQTVEDLAAALERRGFEFTERERLHLNIRHARIDETMSFTGDGLTVEIMHITDRRTWGVVSDGAAMLLIAEAASGAAFPGKPDIIVRQPFIVVVREEPEAGAVRAAVNAILPE
jgi:hypothetical protein